MQEKTQQKQDTMIVRSICRAIEIQSQGDLSKNPSKSQH